jgi:hypothetical protein
LLAWWRKEELGEAQYEERVHYCELENDYDVDRSYVESGDQHEDFMT